MDTTQSKLKSHTQEMHKARSTPASTGALEAIILRNDFYHINYRTLVGINFCLALVVGLLCGFIMIQNHFKPTPTYFPTDPLGQLLPAVETNQTTPTWTDNFISTWGTNTAILLNSYNFANYREALQDMRQYFTPQGYRLFLLALKESTNLDAVTADKMIVSAQPRGPLQIINKGQTSQGAYYWQVEIPMLVSYQSKLKVISQHLRMKMTILRVSTLEFQSGIAIAQIVMRQED